MIDRAPLYRALSKRYGWSARQISEMTLAQQLMYLDTREVGVNPRTGRQTVRFGSLAEARAYRESVGE